MCFWFGMHEIPNADLQELFELYHSEKNVVKKYRFHVLWLRCKGRTYNQLVDIFGLSENTLRSWVREYIKSKNVGHKPRSGRPKTLTKKIVDNIVKTVDKNNPSDEDLLVTSWDCRELRIWLKQKHGVDITAERIRQILIQHGFSYKKVNHKFNKADEEKQYEFLKELASICEKMGENDALYFFDQMRSKLHPRKGYIWTRQKKPFMETDCSHKGAYVIGAVNPVDGEVVSITNEKFNQFVLMEYYNDLLQSTHKNIYLVQDNHPSHHAKKVQAFLDKNRRIKVIWLPEYSPNLNPKENFWNYLRKKLLNNKLFKTVEEMMQAIKTFIANIPANTIKSVCSHQHLINPG